MWRYRGAADHTSEARLLREEALEIAGVKVACYVMTVSPESRGSAYTWWIDKKSYRILREDSANSSAVFTVIKFDEPIDGDLFKFTPPAGAQKMDMHQ